MKTSSIAATLIILLLSPAYSEELNRKDSIEILTRGEIIAQDSAVQKDVWGEHRKFHFVLRQNQTLFSCDLMLMGFQIQDEGGEEFSDETHISCRKLTP